MAPSTERGIVEFVRSIKNVANVSPETVFRYGLMAIALLIMVSGLHHVVEYLFIGLLILWGSVKLRRRDYDFVRTPLDLPVLLFAIWILTTIPFSVDPAYSFVEWRKTVSKILMFYFVVNVVRNERDVRHILLAFMLGVVSLSTFGIVDHVMRGNSLFDKSSHMASLTPSATWLSIYLVMGLPFFWLFLQERKGRHAAWYIGLLFVIIVTALFLSHIRGTWVAFFAQLMAFGLIRVQNNWLKWGGMVVTCGLILAGGYLVYQIDLVKPTDTVSFLSLGSMKIRLDYWQIAVDQILTQPILGYGYGDYIFPKVNKTITEATIALAKRPMIDRNIHNAWLTLAYGVGLPGLALFAFVFFITIRTAIEDLRERKGAFVGNFSFCVLIMIVGVVTAHMFGNTFVGSLAYLFWLLTGLYFALRIHRDASRQTSP